MKTKKAKLKCISDSPNKGDVVAMLKGALEKAKNGELSSVFIGMEHPDGSYDWSFGGRHRNTIEIVGHLEFAKADFLQKMMDRR